MVKAFFIAVALSALVPQEGTSTKGSSAWVTLQVNRSSGYTAPGVVQLLKDSSYLGSVFPGLVAVNDLAVVPEGDLCGAVASAPMTEIVTIGVGGGSAAPVKSATEALIKNLSALEPEEIGQAKRRVAEAEERLELAEKDFAQAQRASRAFVAEKGGFATGEDATEKKLVDRKAQVQDLELELADDQAMRDYLAQAIKNTQPGDDPEKREQKIADLKAQIEELKKQVTAYADKGYDEKHPYMTRTLEQLQVISAALNNLQSERKEPTRRLDLERQLFEVDRRVVVNERRMKAIRSLVERLAGEVVQNEQQKATWNQLDRDFGTASVALSAARDMLNTARNDARRMLAAPWIRVIAGPQYK